MVHSKYSHIGRIISKHHKTQQQNQYSTVQKEAVGAESAVLGEFISAEKPKDNTQQKREEVQNKYIFTQNEGVAVEKGRDKQCSCQNSKRKRGSNTGISFSQTQNHDGGKEQHGEKQQFQMLPDRFIYRGKQTRQRISSGPFIQKVGKGSDDQNKKCAGQEPAF